MNQLPYIPEELWSLIWDFKEAIEVNEAKTIWQHRIHEIHADVVERSLDYWIEWNSFTMGDEWLDDECHLGVGETENNNQYHSNIDHKLRSKIPEPVDTSWRRRKLVDVIGKWRFLGPFQNLSRLPGGGVN